jgi:hypothetical protein
MRVTILAIAAVLLGAPLTSAVPLEAHQDTLLPFEVTYVGSNNPPGIPGPYPCTVIPSRFLPLVRYKSDASFREIHQGKLHRS